MLGEQTGVETLPIVAGQTPVADRRAAPWRRRASAATTWSCSTPPAAPLVDEALMAEVAEVRAAANPHEMLLVADALTGQDAVNTAQGLRRARRHHRHRADPHRRRRPRRRGAVHARRHRQADQAARHRREAGRAGGLPSRSASPAASSAWATSSRLVEKRAAETIDAEKAEKIAAKMREGQFDLDDLAEQLEQMEQDGRHVRHAWACCPASAR